MPASLWDESAIIDCNDAMVRFLKCDSKNNCLERFFAYSTEIFNAIDQYYDLWQNWLSQDSDSDPVRDDTATDDVESTPPSGSSHKIGRNDPCPCGSGKKYKKCCGSNK
jgi:uncharacterized protein YecA (UPF0149 family)